MPLEPMQAFFTGTLWAMLMQHSQTNNKFKYRVEQCISEDGKVKPEILVSFQDGTILRVSLDVVKP